MRSSMKVSFSRDSSGLTSMACPITWPEMRVDAMVTNRAEKSYNSSFRNPSSDKNRLLPLGNIGRFSTCGLGLILTPTVSLQSGQNQGTTDLSVRPDVTDKVSDLNDCEFPDFCRIPETPFLDPLHLDDDISPILPFPLSLYSVGSPIQHQNSQPLTAETALSAEEVMTQDITSLVLNDDLVVQEDIKLVPSSPVPGTPTVDIAEYGMSSRYRVDKASSTTKYPYSNTYSPSLCDNVGLPEILSAIPIYYGRSRDDKFGPSTHSLHDGTRTRPVFRSSAACGHRRSHRIRQPIEPSSPSMTPSPANSPKLCRFPNHRKEGDREARSPSLEPAVPVIHTKTSGHQSSVLCAQPPKRRSNVHESIRTNARCTPRNSPIFRSSLALGRPSHNK